MSGEHLVDLLQHESVRTRIKRIVSGLKASKDTGAHRYATFALLRMVGPSSFSLLASTLLLVVAVTWTVGTESRHSDLSVEAMIMKPETVKLDDVKIEELKPDEVDQPEPVVADENLAPGPVSDNESFAPGPPADYSTGPGETGVGTGGDMDKPVVAFAPVLTKSPLVFKGLYANRAKGGREAALRAYGGFGGGGGAGGAGGALTEVAVDKALKWLKDHQDEDGSWKTVDKTEAVSMTGLALLTFLGHGETPSSPVFGNTVEKAIKYLISNQQPSGLLAPGGRGYGHGICTYALSESYALTRIMAVRDAMEKAVGYLVDGQQATGGFDYSYAKGDRWDMSVSGWQFQALKAAKMAGSTNPKLDEAIEKSINFIKHQAFAPSAGGFCYSGKPGVQSQGGATPSMTGAGTLCLQLLGQGRSTEAKAGVKFLETTTMVWPQSATSAEEAGLKALQAEVDKAEAAVKAATTPAAKALAEDRLKSAQAAVTAKSPAKASVYTWYYVTQAKFQDGGATWDAWNRVFARELVKNQQHDGHWENGDWGGPVYTTTLCALMLEVYYRYLPTYKKVEAVAEVKATSDDDVTVDVK